jgi:effector-binding domain-containing protein
MSSYEVRVAAAGSVPLAVVRRLANRGELAKVVPAGCGIVWEGIRSLNLRGGRHVATYWDDAIHLEVGVELDEPFQGVGEVVPSATPSGLAASVVHFGPYHRLGAAHEAIHQWCSSQALRIVGPNWEVYGHWQPEWDHDPAKIRTEVYYRVEAAR